MIVLVAQLAGGLYSYTPTSARARAFLKKRTPNGSWTRDGRLLVEGRYAGEFGRSLESEGVIQRRASDDEPITTLDFEEQHAIVERLFAGPQQADRSRRLITGAVNAGWARLQTMGCAGTMAFITQKGIAIRESMRRKVAAEALAGPDDTGVMTRQETIG